VYDEKILDLIVQLNIYTDFILLNLNIDRFCHIFLILFSHLIFRRINNFFDIFILFIYLTESDYNKWIFITFKHLNFNHFYFIDNEHD